MTTPTDLQERIRAALEHPELLAPALTHGALLLGLSARPARGPKSYAWVVMGIPRVSPMMLREIAVPHRDPEAWSIRDTEVKPSIVYRALNEAERLPIPMLLANLQGPGLDCTEFEVWMDVGVATRARFSSGGPEPWRAFAAWTKATMRLLHEHAAPGERLLLGDGNDHG
ncbi:Hypothetical protein A7982_10935 [Minicystis rosea]|nr:Hypothetical protein A7982_10935 [Minicystis rosea]